MSELKHYGVLGMKWGVRKDAPSKSERKERKRLTKNLAAAQQNLRIRYKTNVANIRNANLQEHKLEKESGKRVLPWHRREQDRKIEIAERRLDKVLDSLASSKSRYENAVTYENNVSSDLVNYVDGLTKKYGKENVKQLGVKSVVIGRGYFKKVFPMIKTGIVSENIPVIGSGTKARKRARGL